MEGPQIHLCLFLFLFFAPTIPTLMANIAHIDEYWQKRLEEADKYAANSYEPNPENVTSHLNEQVHK